jgi:type I restriction enzyme S subunit
MQRRLVAEFNTVRAEHKRALAEAERLLSSIDDYLLAELGITLPPVPENAIANRIFTAQRRDLAGWRFDPLFHSFKLWHAIEEAHVPHKKLGLCCHYLKSGFAAGGDMQLFDDNGVVQLRPTNLNADRELVFDRNIYLDNALLLERPTDVVQYGEVLFNNTNSQELVGKTAYMNIEEQPFFCSNHITRIRTIETELHPEYLAAFLNTYQRLKVFFSLCTNWNNQSGVNIDSLRQLPIPVPDIGKQTDIATHIGNIRQEAQRLRQQAATELETAKCRVEAMLLGEES